MSDKVPERQGRRRAIIAVGLMAIVLAIAAIVYNSQAPAPEKARAAYKLRYGITPYQDSALPVVADRLGWYRDAGLDVTLVPLSWGDVVAALSSGAIDCAIYNFNSFLGPYESASQGARKLVFYCPTYVFKGQAIMVRRDAGFSLAVAPPDETPDARAQRVTQLAQQLRGKRVGITKGTELEQIVLQALRLADLDAARDVRLVHASPEDTLAAFLAGDLDAFAAGLTERTEARRRGATELLVTSDVTLPVIDGLVTTEVLAHERQAELDALVETWFRTIRYMEADLPANSTHIRDYLRTRASTVYSVEEYQIAWSFNVFPKDPSEADRLFNHATSPFYWKKSWDSVNAYLLEQKKAKTAVPYSAFMGEATLKRLVAKEARR